MIGDRPFPSTDPTKLSRTIIFDWEHVDLKGGFRRDNFELGPAFGGKGAFYVKPTVFAGAYRSTDWSVEIGYKVVGF